MTSYDVNLDDYVWPAVDTQFQKYLALELVNCESDEGSEQQSRQSSIVLGVSPDPKDSYGTWNFDGNMQYIPSSVSPCKGITEYDPELYFCDVVTGSVTIYYSETEYMNLDDNEQSTINLQVRSEVYELLRNAVNNNNDGGDENERHLRRRRRNESVGDFMDESKGIYGLFFLSEPVEDVPSIESIEDTERDGGDSDTTEESSTRSVNPAIAASLTGVTLFAMIIVGFAIQRNRRLSYDEVSDLTIIKPVQTKSIDWDDLDDNSDDDSNLPMKTVVTETNVTATPSAFYRSTRFPDTVDFGTGGVVDETSFHTSRSSHRQVGVAMKYISPDGTVHHHETPSKSFTARNIDFSTPRDPSVDIESLAVSPDPPEENSRGWTSGLGYFQNSLFKRENVSEAPDDEEEWNTTTITIGNSASTSAILAVASDILNTNLKDKNSKQLDLSIDSSVGSSVAPPPSESLIVKDSPVVSRKTPTSVRKSYVRRSPDLSSGKKTPSIERFTPRTAPNSGSSEFSRVGGRTLSFNSPESKDNWASFKTTSPTVYTDSSDPAEEQRRVSPTEISHQASTKEHATVFYDRTEYLKNRRRELEERFNHYKRRISESLSTITNETSSNPAADVEPYRATTPTERRSSNIAS